MIQIYSELIKRLRWCASYDPRIVIQDCNDAADAIEELSEERDMYIKAMADEHNRAARLAWEHRWIPVTVRLPEVGKKVLVFAYGNDTLTARMQKRTENGYPVFECNGIFLEMAKLGRITHWMPLPQPPKEGES